MKSFFEIVIYKYLRMTSRWERDPDMGIMKTIAILSFLNLMQLKSFLIILGSLFTPLKVWEKIFANRSVALVVVFFFAILIGYINYLIFFKGKPKNYYIDKYKLRGKKWWHFIFGLGYAIATFLLFIIAAVLSKYISDHHL